MKQKPLHEAQRLFSQFLKTKGLSATQQRQSICEQVYRNHDHFEAEDIAEALKKRHMRVSRATVYRTLTYLERCRLIRKVDLGHGHFHYEHIVGHTHHEHLYCQQCGRVIEVCDTTLEERIAAIADMHGFTIDSHAVQMFGTCSQCAENEKQNTTERR
ncbi:MAG: transcriptional repressor [Chitinivibrionales bacterium]|nr:transcriptional repressor [Chitinivibrionales bacterium]